MLSTIENSTIVFDASIFRHRSRFITYNISLPNLKQIG